MNKKNIASQANENLLNVLNILAPGLAKPLISSNKNSIKGKAILSAEEERRRRPAPRREDNGPSLSDMPSDEEMERQFGMSNGGDAPKKGKGNTQPPSKDAEGANQAPVENDYDDLPEEGAEDVGDGGLLGDEGSAEDDLAEAAPEAEGETEEDMKVGPYDLTFHLRKIISAFDQVVREAEQLRKQTESITANMTSEQQASWIEQRRFFIETAKEAEEKWSEFKKVLLNFSLTPKL